MSVKEKRPARDEGAAGECLEKVSARIGGQVLLALGRPACLHRVQVRLLWECHYRVNVLVGADAASATVAHSFFLQADANGTIVASTPTIAKQY
jgi:hypothetical protein